jgi:hypothetical protein
MQIERGGPKRKWLTKDQSERLEELYRKYNGDWRGHDAEVEDLAAELGLTVRIRLDRVYQRRRWRRFSLAARPTYALCSSPQPLIRPSRNPFRW